MSEKRNQNLEAVDRLNQASDKLYCLSTLDEVFSQGINPKAASGMSSFLREVAKELEIISESLNKN